jgi:hypothetical protein
MNDMSIRSLFAVLPLALLLSCSSQPKEEKKDSVVQNHDMNMTDEMHRLAADSTKPKTNPYKDAKIECKVFNNDSLKQESNPHGYGYDIYLFDALYIHQPNIPAINGNRGYHTREQARTAATLVMYKIRNNIMPPALSIEELDSIGVLK